MCIGISECCVGSDFTMYLDSSDWDQLVELKLASISKECEIARF